MRNPIISIIHWLFLKNFPILLIILEKFKEPILASLDFNQPFSRDALHNQIWSTKTVIYSSLGIGVSYIFMRFEPSDLKQETLHILLALLDMPEDSALIILFFLLLITPNCH